MEEETKSFSDAPEGLKQEPTSPESPPIKVPRIAPDALSPIGVENMEVVKSHSAAIPGTSSNSADATLNAAVDGMMQEMRDVQLEAHGPAHLAMDR